MAEENEDIDDKLDDDIGQEEEASDTPVGGDVNRKKIIMILLPLLLVVGAAVGVYFSGVADNMFSGVAEKVEDVKASASEALSHREVVNTVFYDLPELVVNLNSHSRKQGSLMRIKIALEIEKATDIPRIEEVLPRVTDTLIVHLREVRPEELEGSAGVYRIKEELLSRINRAVRPARVYDIRFKQFEIH